MVRVRWMLLVAGLLSAPAGVALLSPSAHASVSTAATLEGLVEKAQLAAVVEPVESRSQWENGRIVTYTKLHVVERMGGKSSDDVWVMTLGGTVGELGQSVAGEPGFAKGERSLVFLRPSSPSAFLVVARAQGQYPLARVDDRVVVTANLRTGTVLPPKQEAVRPPLAPTTKVAAHVHLHGRELGDVRNEVKTLWTRLHADER